MADSFAVCLVELAGFYRTGISMFHTCRRTDIFPFITLANLIVLKNLHVLEQISPIGGILHISSRISFLLAMVSIKAIKTPLTTSHSAISIRAMLFPQQGWISSAYAQEMCKGIFE